MAHQIKLAWKVLVAGTPLGPVAAAAKLAAVPLYADATTDPVLGQQFGLTVAADATTHDAVSATRTLTLNMDSASGAPFAPPPFPCRPDTATPPTLPYPMRRAVTLAGAFLTTTGSAIVATSANQTTALNPGDVVEFLSQLGVFYAIALGGVGSTSVTLTAPYTGTTADGEAVKVVAAPATVAAIYSTSPLDTAGVATNPAIPAGSGARTVSLSYLDSTGAGPFTVAVTLQGKFPAPVALAGGSKDIATITDLHVTASGSFANSVGELTLCELSAAPPAIPAGATRAEFQRLTDQAQNTIVRALAYLPPSYFALAQQGAAAPQLAGDFIVTTGSADVPTTVDQTGALAHGNVIQFAAQLENDTPTGRAPVFYTVDTVTPKLVKLTEAFSGLGPQNQRQSGDTGSKGVKGTELLNFPSAASLYDPAPGAPPTAAQLSAPLAQYVNPGNAVPPPNPPLAPQTMVPAPTFLSGLFTQTIQLALAVPVEPLAITFA